MNEDENSGTTQETNAVTATFNLRYQPIQDLFFNAVFSANIQNANIDTWYGEKSFHSSCLRGCESDEIQMLAVICHMEENSVSNLLRI